MVDISRLPGKIKFHYRKKKQNRIFFFLFSILSCLNLNKLIKSDLSLPIIVLLVVKINTFQNVGKKIFQISPLIQKIYYQKKWKEEKR